MKYNNAVHEMLIQFPMLKQVYNDERDYIKDLAHLCYPVVFVPFIRKAAINKDETIIIKISKFLEDMATSQDPFVSELLVVSLLETIVAERELISYLKKYLHDQTLHYLTVLEKETGWA